MKDLKTYMYEALDDNVELRSLEVKWDGPEELFIQVPESYSESDIQIYLDDTLLDKMPGENEEAQKAFGNNKKDITDSYFEYDSMEAAQGTKQKADIEWDEHYDSSTNGTNMVVMRIRGIKYCLLFDKFIVEKTDDIREVLYNLFNGIGDSEELPFELVLNKENINWK